ncbi:Transposase IS116/IS110/IS902 family protein [Candidatus Venteria ishoeyi]|uniref:Transposase IS116/IS110/IS902 family protein n=1 Tax=Candidatus Venteria ishoeyi TaxID=1899563 RepID=A0A1H6FA27_9GAMM|nr:Transposase IS116/IS110/IS902 family protein [Candidatus Venteria ishoeyi]
MLGHTVKLIPPYQVKPFVIGNKNDHNDAIAIAEAAHRPKASFVPVKTLEQQDIQSLQRIRERLIRQRSATSNQLRGLLAEYGIILPTGLYRLRKGLPDILEDAQQPLTPVARKFIQMFYQELLAYDKRIQETENETIALLQTDEDYQRLQTIPGVGPIIAANMLAAVGDAKYFKNGRQMAAWIGLTPKQHASGEISRLSGISKRGNSHLRRLLIHGARTVLNWSGAKTANSAYGCKHSVPELIPVKSLSPWQTNWRVLSGQCWRINKIIRQHKPRNNQRIKANI